ncbi:unnamed protein product, partial [Symbiodinium pilosum]
DECPEPEAPRRMSTQRNLATWKRLVQTIFLMLATARQQMVLDYVVKRDEDTNSQPSSSTAPVRSKKGKGEPINQGLGKPLPRSKGKLKGNVVDMSGLRLSLAAPGGEPEVGKGRPSWWDSIFTTKIASKDDLLRPSTHTEVQDSIEKVSECQFGEDCRDLGDQHGRGDDRCRDGRAPEGQDRNVRKKGAGVFLHGSYLEDTSSPQLRSLKRSILQGGWLLKAVMILLTTATQTPPSSMSSVGLDAPHEHFLWSSEAQEWMSTDESKASPSSRTPTPATRTKDKDMIHEVQDGMIHCYLYSVSDALLSWSTDHFGRTAPLTKDHKRVVAASFNKVDVAEVYSPPRVTKRARLLGLRPGWALDLSTGWDFSKRAHRRAALSLLSKTRPAVLILSPPCCVFSPLRNLTNHKRDFTEVQSEEAQGRQHLDFAVALANLQIENGRGFLFEHPLGAKSWRTASLRRLATNQAVFTVQLDMCAFGLQGTQGLHKKPTLLLTNVEELASTLARRCNQQHEHQPIEGGTLSRASAQYTDAFVDAILKGIRKHLFFEA